MPWFIAENKKVLKNREADSTKKRPMVISIKRILVVDDEAEFVNPIYRHLKREGFIMDLTISVEEARRKIDDSAYWSPYYRIS